MSEYVHVASSGPSAAFFDLDRTLISGSSAFTLARAAQSARLMPTRELLRDALGAALFKLRGDHGNDVAADARDRILGFIGGQRRDDLQSLNERVIPTLLGRIRPEERSMLDVHRPAKGSTFTGSASP